MKPADQSAARGIGTAIPADDIIARIRQSRVGFEHKAITETGIRAGGRKRPADYPINDEGSPIKVLNFNAVGGATTMYTAHFPRLPPSAFRMKSRDGVADD